MFDFAISTKFESSRYGHSDDKCLKKLINGGKIMECANKAYWAFVIEVRKLQCAFDNAYDILDTETLRIHMDAINKAFNELEDE